MPLRSSLFLDVTERRLVDTDVSGQPVAQVVKGQPVQEEFTVLLTSCLAITSEQLNTCCGGNP